MPPSAPSLTVSLFNDSNIQGDFYTNDAALNTVKVLRKGDTLQYQILKYDTATSSWSIVSGWSGTYTKPLIDGAYKVQVRELTKTNTVYATGEITFTLDTQVTALTVALSVDSGVSNSDKITSDGALAITGVESGATVQYSTNGGTSWSTSFTAQEGVNNLLVRQIDKAGNISANTAFSFTLDRLSAAPTVALSVDSGSSNGDKITSNGSLTLAGVESGATVQYSTDGGTSWSSTFTAQEGVNNVLVRQADAAGNISASTSFSFTLDTQVAPLSVALTVDSGTSGSDKITSNGALTVSGVESGATVYYSTNNGTSWSTGFTAQEGVNNLLVRQIDQAGNVSASTAFSFTLDTLATAPSVSLAQDTGISSTDKYTKNGALNVTGAESGATVQYSTDGGSVWSSSFTAAEGSNTVLVRQTDVAGNVSASTAFSFTLDTLVATPTAALTVDSGASDTDKITNDGRLTITGAEQGATVQYSTNGGVTWSSNFTALTGGNNVLVRQFDQAGNVSSSSSIKFTLDTTAPSAQVNGISALSDDTFAIGGTASDFVTNIASQTITGTFTGTLASGESLQISADGGATWITAALIDSSHWQATGIGLQEGSHNLLARSIDLAGNVTTGVSLAYILDTAPPTAMVTGIDVLSSDTFGPNGTNSDYITSVAAQTLSGTYSGVLGADEHIEISIDGGETWMAATIVDSSHWQLTGVTLLDGLNLLMTRTTDIAGNETEGSVQVYTLDTQVAAPTVALANDTSGGSNISSEGALALGGIEANATVEYSTDNGANWSATFTAQEGSNMVLVRQTDVAGNVSSSTSLSFVLDTQIAAPLVALSQDTGSSNSDTITYNGALTVSGIESSAIVEYSTDNGATWGGVFGAHEGINDVLVRQIDQAGNEARTSFSFTVDSSIATLTVALANDTSGGSGITSDATLALSGVESGASVQYSTDGTLWENFFTAQEGTNTVYVRQTDVAGNVSSVSAPLTFTLDTPPSPPVVALQTDTSGGLNISNQGALSVTGLKTGASVDYSIDNGNTWSSTFTAQEGLNTILVRQTDLSGHEARASFSFTLDTQVNAPNVALFNDTSGGLNISNDDELYVSGIENGATIQYSTDGSNWLSSFTAQEGSNTVHVRQIDLAGNVSASTIFTFTYDTQVAAPVVALLNDTSGGQGITNDGTLSVTGIETGALAVQYSLDNGDTWSAIANFSAQPGFNELLVRQIDQAGNEARTYFSFTLDVAPPEASVTEILSLNNDSFAAGTSGTASDFVTNAANQTVSGTYAGTLAAGDRIQVSADGGLTWADALIDDASHWHADNVALQNGSHALTTRTVDGVGNALAGASHAYTLDTVAPGAPMFSLSQDTGTSGSDGITSSAMLTGTAEAGSLVKIYNGQTLLGSTTADNVGQWSYTPSLADGAYSLTATATDAAGNVSQLGQFNDPNSGVVYNASNGHYYKFVNASVDWNTAVAAAASQGGYLATVTSAQENSFVTSIMAANSRAWLGASDAAVEGQWKWMTGPETGNTLSYFNWMSGQPDNNWGGTEDYVEIWQSQNGQWNDVAYNRSAAQTDNSYIIEFDTNPQGITLDNTPPSTPTFSLANDTGTSNADGITKNAALTGTAEAGSLVKIYNGQTLLGSTTADNAGQWSYTPTLADGTYNLTATATDAAGNVSQLGQFSDPNSGVVYNASNGHYYKFVSASVDWNTAVAAAASQGGYLATVTSGQENSFILGIMDANSIAWLGGSDAGQEGQWKWETGPETGALFFQDTEGSGTTLPGYYSNWYTPASEPNNYLGSEHYLSISNNSNYWTPGTWNDAPNAGYPFPLSYVIEFDANPQDITLDTTASTTLMVSGDNNGDGLLDSTERGAMNLSGVVNGVENGRTVTVSVNGYNYTTSVANSQWTLAGSALDATSTSLSNALANGSNTLTASVSDLAGNLATANATVNLNTSIGTIYDAEANFSATTNPNGVWSYGVTANTSPSSTFTKYTTHDYLTVGGIVLERWSNGTTDPNILHNSTNTDAVSGSLTIPAHSIEFHPGQSGELSVVRFEATQTGIYSLSSVFAGLNFTSSDVYISLNGSAFYHQFINGKGATQSFLANTALQQGDKIDFAVGFGSNGNYSSDSTSLDAILQLDSNHVFSYEAQSEWGTAIASFGTHNSIALNDAIDTSAVNGNVLVVDYELLAGLTGANMGSFTNPTGNNYSTLGADDLVNGAAATQDHAQFLYNAGTGALSFDADGTGVQGAVLVTTIGTGAAAHPGSLLATDIVVTH